MILEIDTKEIQRIIESASKGDWMPLGIIVFCLGIIIFLFIFILGMKEKQILEKHCQMDGKHDAMDKNLEKLTEISAEMKTMLAVHDNEIKDLKRA